RTGDGVRSAFFFSSRRRHTRSKRDWSSDVCSSDLGGENRRRRSGRSAGAGAPVARGSQGSVSHVLAVLEQRDGALRKVSYEVVRSEEHTSELQSRFDLVCRLLLEKKKKKKVRSQED